MAATPEKLVKNKVVAQLKKLGAYYFYPVTGGWGASGVPDIIACYRGRFFGIECKTKGNKPTKLQQINLDNIKAQGGAALVIDETNVKDLTSIMENFDGILDCAVDHGA